MDRGLDIAERSVAHTLFMYPIILRTWARFVDARHWAVRGVAGNDAT